jgi:hypothetical protein
MVPVLVTVSTRTDRNPAKISPKSSNVASTAMAGASVTSSVTG